MEVEYGDEEAAEWCSCEGALTVLVRRVVVGVVRGVDVAAQLVQLRVGADVGVQVG